MNQVINLLELSLIVEQSGYTGPDEYYFTDWVLELHQKGSATNWTTLSSLYSISVPYNLSIIL